MRCWDALCWPFFEAYRVLSSSRCPDGTNFQWTSPRLPKQQMSMVFILDFFRSRVIWRRPLFGFAASFQGHIGRTSPHHPFSTCCKQFSATDIWRSSSEKCFWTIFAQSFLIPKFSVKICLNSFAVNISFVHQLIIRVCTRTSTFHTLTAIFVFFVPMKHLWTTQRIATVRFRSRIPPFLRKSWSLHFALNYVFPKDDRARISIKFQSRSVTTTVQPYLIVRPRTHLKFTTKSRKITVWLIKLQPTRNFIK